MISAPLVVGYKGEIGRFILAGFLEDLPKANDILCVDVNNSDEDVRERIKKADFIFLCVPLQHTAQWLERYFVDLEGKVVVEQCSVKASLYENDLLKELNFLSMHLLFRPSATPVKDRRGLVFSERLPSELVERFGEEMARALKTSIVSIPAGETQAYLIHDRLMARHQSLVHRVLLVLASKLSDAEVQTFVGQRVCELADRIRSGDPVLYRLIQENRFVEGELAEYELSLNRFSPEDLDREAH